MEENYLRNVFPISWITESPYFMKFMNHWFSYSKDNLLLADFASGEHDRVPTFFSKILPQELGVSNNHEKRIIIYCIDIHALRLDSLLGKLEEDDLLENVRVIHASLEEMNTKAELRNQSIEFIVEHADTACWLDDFLVNEEKIPPECFDVGVLNTDVVGYLFKYYKEYTDPNASLHSIYNSLKREGLLIVTMPCMQYKVDNIAALENIGFSYIEGFDIDVSTEVKMPVKRDVQLHKLSRLGHYSFLIFSKS